MLTLKEIKKDYMTSSERVRALRGVTLSFRKKEFVSILGPSGCGKTTLLNIIGGLDHYTSGDLIIRGKSTKLYTDRDWDVYRNHRIGFIFQSYNLIPHQSVLGNVELALTISGISREERIQRAKTALDRVGLKNQYYKKPNQLSGGQCQRVAIARALVNDPEILLADEPTGALDTQTSRQIMELIREISGERLVIMVTHNPEIADEYSSRIIRLLDGEVIEDTNPFSEKEEQQEVSATLSEEAYETLEEEKRAKNKRELSALRRKRKERAKMSFFTAFMLSAKNLISKRGRTAMVGFAGSIGIIGIALVLAFSAGIKGYVASMQDDMLSGNPITISETTYDLDALSGMMDTSDKIEIIKEPNKVYINSLVEYLASTSKNLTSLIIQNTITEDYVKYLRDMPEEYYSAMLFDYGIALAPSIYTQFKYGNTVENVSIQLITDRYTSILKETEFKDYASFVTALAPSFKQMPSNIDYLKEQYELVGEGSKYAAEAGEIMLVLDADDELSDLLLARLGYYTQEEFLEIVNKATSDNGEYDESLYKEYFEYDELLGKTFTVYSNDQIFSKQSLFGNDYYTYNGYASDIEGEGTELKVVGILTPKDNVSFGVLQSGIYYTEELTNHILDMNADSEIFDFANSEAGHKTLSMSSYAITYKYDFEFTKNGESGKEVISKDGVMGYVVPPIISSMMSMSSFGPGGSGGGTGGGTGGSGALGIEDEDLRESFIRSLGGNGLANGIKIYPVSFDQKDMVTDYLTKWNEDGDILVDGETITAENRNDVTYTDTLSIVIAMINNMIDIISYALIAFTSISLVVSTVMIGIITYVSVVERIKEIGVIRSLGGRKKDVSHLFNAETFIIGLLAGTFGIGITYLVSAVANAILKPLIGYSSIAALPFTQALILIALSIALTLISGLIPARKAAKQDPVVALRTE